jgi:hypothetical protein
MRQQCLSDLMRTYATTSTAVAYNISRAIESMALKHSDCRCIPYVKSVTSGATKDAQHGIMSQCL